MATTSAAGKKKQNGKKKDRRLVKTDQAIQEAFRSIVVEGGLDALSISEIARRANIDRKTFYLHYPSIADLMEEVIATKIEDISMGVTLRVAAGESEVVKILVEESNRVFAADLAYHQGLVRYTPIEQFVNRAWDAAYGAMHLLAEGAFSGNEYEFAATLRFSLAGMAALYRNFLLSGDCDFQKFTPAVERALNYALLSFGLDPQTIEFSSLTPLMGD